MLVDPHSSRVRAYWGIWFWNKNSSLFDGNDAKKEKHSLRYLTLFSKKCHQKRNVFIQNLISQYVLK